ncbi:MAG: hypothetical protein V4719_29175 [Planctomycetota bacterium]
MIIDTFPKEISREFQISEEKWSAFREVLVREGYFELAEEYGDNVFDSGTEVITVQIGDQKKTIRLYFLLNWVSKNNAKLAESRRAVRVFTFVRDWFDDADAVDLRDSALQVLGKPKRD